MSEADKQTVPVHVGLILDGNRRWARAQGLPTLEGHQKGNANLKKIAKYAIKERKVRYLSAYVFSTENWSRSQEEVDYLMNLLLWVAKHETKELHKDNIRVRVLGSRDRLSSKIIKAIDDAEEKTKHNDGGTLALCLNYGGQVEIADSVKKIISSGVPARDVDARLVAEHLYAPDIPPLDLIIRTSGEQRLSGFMLYRAEYAELYFSRKHWPDFTEKDLDEALAEYARRHRRFGA